MRYLAPFRITSAERLICLVAQAVWRSGDVRTRTPGSPCLRIRWVELETALVPVLVL